VFPLQGVSTFFINFVITAMLSGIPAVQLRLVPLVVYWGTKLVKGKTSTDRALFDGPLAPVSVPYGSFFPSILYIVALFAIYWVIAPLLAAVCFLYFFGLYVVYRYQFLFVIVPT
jgi:hypothetical protein